MEKRMPWSKFYWGDWRHDHGLRLCGLAAKGLWMEMLCCMHASSEQGYLVVCSRPANNAEIAKMVGVDKRTVDRLLAELEQAGVFSRDERGAIFSRRMLEDIGRSRRNADNGKLGGNPQLKKNNEVTPLDVKPPVKARAETETEEEKKGYNRSDFLGFPARENAPPDPMNTGIVGIVPEKGTGRPLCNGWYIDKVVEQCQEAARMPVVSSFSANKTVAAWLLANREPDDICGVIRRLSSRSNVTPHSLGYFDRAVMQDTIAKPLRKEARA